MASQKPAIEVQITSESDMHCFRIIFHGRHEPEQGETVPVEIMMHAKTLVDLIHKCSMALGEWQRTSTEYLIERLTGGSPRSALNVAHVIQLAAAVAAYDWRTSVSEAEHLERIAAMNQLRQEMRKTGEQ